MVLETFLHSSIDSHDAYGFDIDTLDDFAVGHHSDGGQGRFNQFADGGADLGRAEDDSAEALGHEFADVGGDGFGDGSGELWWEGEEAAAVVAFDVTVEGVFEGGVEGDAVDSAGFVAVLAADGAGEAVADGFGEDFDVFGFGGPFAEGFEEGVEVADGDAFAEEILQNFLEFAGFDLPWDDFLDKSGKIASRTVGMSTRFAIRARLALAN